MKVSRKRVQITTFTIFAILVLLAFTNNWFVIDEEMKGNIDTPDSEIIKVDDFDYTEIDEEVESCYISVVYLGGYAYSPIGWLSNDLYNKNNDFERGEKIGEVTLDLKDKVYTDVPPDFSSTHNLGSTIYAIKGIKTERAVMLVEGSYQTVLYRERKAVMSENDPIDLTVKEVVDMISDSEEVLYIELRSEENASWMNDINNDELNNMIRQELMSEAIKNSGELGTNPYSSNRIPINIILADGAALHMQVHPSTNYAYIFGGYISVSDEFITLLKQLSEEQAKSTIVDLIPYKKDEVNYMIINDHIKNQEITCNEPSWTFEALNMVMSYYRISEIEKNDSNILVSIDIGQSENDKIRIKYYDDNTLMIDDKYYEIMKGSVTYDDLIQFIENYNY